MIERDRRENGQALLIMIFGVVALAAFVGLAIDGGRLYALRRQVQNAADAAALAGAQELATMISQCQAGTTANDYKVGQAVADFSELNGVVEGSADGDVYAAYVDKDSVQIGPVGQVGSIPNGATGVYARLVATQTTTFMRLFGAREIVAPGEATAMTGPVFQVGGGILPIGVPEVVASELGKNEPFVILDTAEAFCRTKEVESCIGYDEDDKEVGTSAQRGWLNLSYIYNAQYVNSPKPPDRVLKSNMNTSGCAYNGDGSVDAENTGIKGWMSGECTYPYFVVAGGQGKLNGDFIVGKPGVAQAGLNSLGYGEGDLVYAPVFDYIYQWGDIDKYLPEPDLGWAKGQFFYYHVVGFIGFEITGVDGKDLNGTFKDLILGDGQIAPSSGIGSGTCTQNLVFGVRLWE